MARSITSLLSRKSVVGVSNWVYRTGSCFVSPMSTVSVSDESLRCPASLPSRISPWLMLPPPTESSSGNKVYNFYSLSQDKVLSLNKISAAAGEEEKTGVPVPEDDAQIVGSSHGWLALHNENNSDLFLSNPLSRRHVKLPAINKLPENNSCVGHVIVSCSPNVEGDDDCRALMTYGPENRLAFCCPGSRSTEWTPIGDWYYEFKGCRSARAYEACVYSSRQKLFYCITRSSEFEAWDLSNPVSPKLIPMVLSIEPTSDDSELDDSELDRRLAGEMELKDHSMEHKSLIVNEHSGDLFLVTRHIIERMNLDGSYAEEEACDVDNYDPMNDLNKFPHKTISFDVHKYDPENEIFRYMDKCSLDGLSFFVGCNHGFALRASEFPELKPDSIYFTDVSSLPDGVACRYGGHDIGIFSYKDGTTISPCYYPCDLQSFKRIKPIPRWFTPSPL
ncbi:hypothetical protein ABFX02_08G130700 [Erythranthe guttata]